MSFPSSLPGYWLAALSCLVICSTVQPGTAGQKTVSGNLPPAVKLLVSKGAPPAAKQLNLAISLPIHNPDQLKQFLGELYDPASPSYRQYLTPEQFTERFGPSPAEYEAVMQFAQASNLTVTARHPNRLALDVSGKVADVEKAFHVMLRTYAHPTESRDFYAPDTDPTVDAALPILSVSGLDNYSIRKPNLKLRPNATSSAISPKLGSGPNGGYIGNDFRSAYVPGVSLTGSGQVVGLVEFDGYRSSDITSYEQQAGLAAVPLQNVFVDGYNGAAGSDNSEVCLDIEVAIAMAPGLTKVIVYEAPNGSPWEDILNRMANDNAAKQLSCSWGGGPPDATAEQIFQQMAAQGQSFFNASGDSDAFSGSIPFPSDSPNIVQVGGTTLSTVSGGGSWSSETTWNPGGGTGSSGGISPTYSIPTWQQGINMTANQGSTTRRNVPDVALTADNVYVTFDGGAADTFGGTSCAAPLWAGFTALVNQQAAANGLASVGFLNPAIYAIGKGANYTSRFHDITTGNNITNTSGGKFSAVSGYDLCTGWGTPAGNNLISDLAGGSGPSATPTPTPGGTPTPTPTSTPPPTGPSVMLSPPPGSTFNSSSVTFTWSAGTATANFLFVGTSQDKADIYNSGTTTDQSKTVTGIPTDGSTIFVTLGSQVNGSWSSTDYTYKAFDPSATPTPTPTATPTPTPTPSAGTVIPSNVTIGLQAIANGSYVTAENAGNSSLIANRPALALQEEFTIQDLGNGYIALKSLVNGLYVTAENAGASPLIANRGAVGLWEQFQLVDSGSGTFALLARVNGKYVCADNAGNSPLIANRSAAPVGGWEQFNLIITLRAVANNQIVTAENAGNSALIANRGAIGLWEQFQFINSSPGYFALKAKVNGKYVTAENAGNSPLIANRNAAPPGGWEQFQWIVGSDGTVALKALVNGRFVCADNAGNSPLIANRVAAPAGGWERFY